MGERERVRERTLESEVINCQHSGKPGKLICKATPTPKKEEKTKKWQRTKNHKETIFLNGQKGHFFRKFLSFVSCSLKKRQ